MGSTRKRAWQTVGGWMLMACMLLSSALPAEVTAADTRVALVIGNAAYKQLPLKNPVNDARDIATRLRSLGFRVILRENLAHKQIGSALREFRTALSPGVVAVFFYAGHGVQLKGENYLPVVDADISGEEDVPQQSLAVRQVMDVLTDAKTGVNLVFLDACRDNPYARSFRSASRGLGRESAPSGTIISFATRPGSVAQDGDGPNGLYTAALLRALDKPNQPIEQTLKQVVSLVKAYSRNQQEPWMEGSLEGDFCFGNCASGTVSGASMGSERDAELLFWESIKNSSAATDLQAYLERFPSGMFATLARVRLPRASTESPRGDPPGAAAPQTFRDCERCPLMTRLPGGSFTMGSLPLEARDDETPQRLVHIKPFAVGVYEITQEQWQYADMQNNSQPFGANLPVSNLTWEEAQQFVEKLSRKANRRYRLLTEAEWEYAARAGTQTDYFWGDEAANADVYSVGFESPAVMPVGSRKPNAWGLHDTSGNVYEWVVDCYTKDYSHMADGVSATDWQEMANVNCTNGRVMRGGSIDSLSITYRTAYRAYGVTARADVGLRVAVDID